MLKAATIVRKYAGEAAVYNNKVKGGRSIKIEGFNTAEDYAAAVQDLQAAGYTVKVKVYTSNPVLFTSIPKYKTARLLCYV